MLVIPRGTTSELPLIGITTDRNYQLLELPTFGITNLCNFQQKHRTRTPALRAVDRTNLPQSRAKCIIVVAAKTTARKYSPRTLR